MKKYIFLVLALSWMCVIYLFSAQTAQTSGAESIFITEKILRIFIDSPSETLLDISETVFRKLCHFAEYGALAVLWFITLRSFGVKQNKLWTAICICFIYCVTDEIHQYFVPGRACRFYDIIIDTAGSATGYAVSYFITKKRLKKITKS